MEAVVKSLDPNSTSSRELVLDSATEIIGYVVKTYVGLGIRVGQILQLFSGFRLSISIWKHKGLQLVRTRAPSSCTI
jgi:hypothetical protein